MEVPIIFDLFAFSITERKYPIYKRELCALVKFVTKYDYLFRNLAIPGVVHTDHKPLLRFLNSNHHEGIYGHWAARLRSLSVKVAFISGARNKVADGLSRIIFLTPDCEDDNIVLALKPEFDRQDEKNAWVWKDGKGGFDDFLSSLDQSEKSEVIDHGTLHGSSVFNLDAIATSVDARWDSAYRASTWFGAYYTYLADDVLPTTLSARAQKSFFNKILDFRLDANGLLWIHHQERHLPCIPEGKVSAILQEAHDHSGHWGKLGTMSKLVGHAYWPSQSTDVERYIQGCLQCARHAPAARSQPLHPVLVTRPGQLMGMDFIGPLKKTSAGNEFILHAMDYFARFSTAEASPTADVPDVTKFLTRVFDIYFTPEALYLDRGQHFENDELKSFLRDRGVAVDFSPSGSSKSTGMIEVGNRILEGVIRKNTTEWDLGLSNSVKEVNVRVVDHLLHSPREIVMGVPTNALRAARLSVVDSSTIGTWVEFLKGKEAHRDSVQRFLEWKGCIRDEVSRLSKEKKATEKLRYDRGVTAFVHQLSSLVMLYQKNTGKQPQA